MSTNTYLPSIHNEQSATGQGDLPTLAMLFAESWLTHLGNKGKQMHSDPRLIAAAQGQAEWLAVHDFVPGHPHQGEDGKNANDRVRAAGYALPANYLAGHNNVESATHSWDVDIDEVVGDLMNHPTHYDHMHNTGSFAAHTVWGIGYARNFWTVVTAPMEE